MKTTFLLLLLGSIALLGFALMQKQNETAKKVFGGNRVTQIGLVVRDVERSARAYADLLGVEVPNVIITDPLEQAHTEFRGEPTEARAKLAFFHLENISIELIEPIGGPSTWQEFLETRGEGIHHIAFQVDGMDKHITLLESKGARLEQRGDFTGGSYAYIDAQKQLGLILELLTSTD
jgi:methylmalonyl-CoA/ethylmalonyl-CoA epimerase